MPEHILPSKNLRIVVFIILFLCSPTGYIIGQDVLLDSQTDVNAFDPATTFISGNLTLSSQLSDSITDISNLSNIEYIGGTLIIRGTKVSDLDALSNLDSIGVDLHIYFNPWLEQIDAFSNLHTIGEDVKIYGNALLERISGLAGLSTIEGDLQIYNLPAMMTLDGLQNITSIVKDAVINGNPALTSLGALSNLTYVGGVLNISGLINLNGLQSLVHIGEGLTISGEELIDINGLSNLQTIDGHLNIVSTSLTGFTGFSSLTSIGGTLEIRSNLLLTDVAGFQSLMHTGLLYIVDNNGLKHISGFPNLTTAGGLKISLNYFLEDISGLNNLVTVNGDISFYENSALKNISGLSNIQVAHTLEMGPNNGLKNFEGGLSDLNTLTNNLHLYNTELESLTGLSNLMTVEGSVVLNGNDFLKNLNGLANLVSIGGDLKVNGSNDLQNIDSLMNLHSVQGNLEILSNEILPDIDGLANLSAVGGNILIQPNSHLTNLDGLGSLITVGGEFRICCLSNLTNLDSLSDLISVGGILSIYLTELTNVDGLINLNTVGGLEIYYNPSLTSIDGLRNIKHVGGNFKIQSNSSLNVCCPIIDLLLKPELIDGTITINLNLPECNSVSEIIHAPRCGAVIVFNDYNANCTREQEEPGLSQRRVLVDPGSYIFVSDHNGRIDISDLPLGLYSMVVDTAGPWYTDCSIVRNFEIITTDSFPSIAPLPMTATNPCSSPSVTMEMPFARPCFENQKVFIETCNGPLATGVIYDALLVVMLDSNLVLQSASHLFTALNLHSYQFELGDIYPDECIKIEINVMVSCDAVQGQTLCIKSELFPVDTCVFDNTTHTFTSPSGSCNKAYEGTHIEIAGRCTGDSISFVITNTTAKDANCYTPVRLYGDTELLLNDSILLLSNQQRTFTVPADGKTYRMEADQHPDHFSLSRPNATIERCGDLMNWTPGLVNAFYLDDADPIVDILCTEVRGSYDPNDKTGYPLGITNQHRVLPNQPLEYRIRFQNTGTDTAFTVVILDTLDTDLDIFSVVPGVTSHPSSFRLFGSRVLEWRFDNILLPDSIINEPESHGFVTFQVQQIRNLPNGVLISNHAGIYFDFNDPVITNKSWHVIDDQIQGVISSVPVADPNKSHVYAFPNPTSGVIHLAMNTKYQRVAIEVMSMAGQLVYQNMYSSSDIKQIELTNSGIYFIRIRMGNHVEILKVIVL